MGFKMPVVPVLRFWLWISVSLAEIPCSTPVRGVGRPPVGGVWSTPVGGVGSPPVGGVGDPTN